MSLVQTSTVGGLLTTWLSREFIKALEFELQYWKFTNKNVIPIGSGRIGQVNVFSNPTAQLTLTEGSVTLNEITMTTTLTAVTINEMGEFFPVSSLVDYASVEGYREELKKRMVYGGALAIDKTILAALDATASLLWYSTDRVPVQGQATDPNTSFGGGSATTLIAAAKRVRNFGTRGFRGVAGHPDDQLAVMLSPQAELDMTTEVTTGRITWAQINTNVQGVQAQEKAIMGTIGSIYGIACYRTQNFTTTTRATSGSASTNYLLGDGALASMTFAAMQPDVYINTPSSTDVGNPYRNRYTIAWHAFFGVAAGPDAAATRIVRYYTLGI